MGAQFSGAGLDHFLDEPSADAMAHKDNIGFRAICGEQVIEELNVSLYLRWQGHGGGIGVRLVTADVRGQAQVSVGKDGEK